MAITNEFLKGLQVEDRIRYLIPSTPGTTVVGTADGIEEVLAVPGAGQTVIGTATGPVAVRDDRRAAVGKLRTYHTALAKRETTPVDILCIGTSLTEGAQVSTLEKRWVARLRDKLRARYPVAGVVGGQGYLATDYGSPPLSGEAFTVSGGATGTGGSGLFGLGRRYYTMTATGHKITTTVTCSSFDVLYTRGTSQGVMGVKIDAGAVTNVSTTGSTQSGTKWSSGALTPGPHTIEISWVSGGKIDIEGIMVYNGDETKGIRMWEGGIGGAKSEKFLINGSTFWHRAISAVQPHLAIIELGTNDWWYYTGDTGGSFGVYPPATVKSNIQNLITGIRANCTTNPSIVLIAVHHRGDEWASGSEVPWDQYLAMYDEIAAADASVSVCNIPHRIGPTPWQGSGLIAADNVHLNDSGAEFYANALASFLEP